MAAHDGRFNPTMGAACTITLDVAPDDCIKGARNTRCKRNLIHAVAIALEQARLVSIQSQDLETICGLQDSHQWLGVETVGHDRQFRDGTLQPVHAKQIRCAQHRQAIQVVVPEFRIVRQCVERRQQWVVFAIRIPLPQ